MKGGDIDLLLVADSAQSAAHLRYVKAQIFAAIFMQIDEQKIDLLIADPKSLVEDPFVHKVFAESILIQRLESKP